jgi:hypothetical protein
LGFAKGSGRDVIQDANTSILNPARPSFIVSAPEALISVKEGSWRFDRFF